jgi:hypothetical protein
MKAPASTQGDRLLSKLPEQGAGTIDILAGDLVKMTNGLC